MQLVQFVFYWSSFGRKPHYLDLPSIGWDRDGKMGRGFTRNRFRSNALIYLETEYRTDITKNGFLGAVFLPIYLQFQSWTLTILRNGILPLGQDYVLNGISKTIVIGF